MPRFATAALEWAVLFALWMLLVGNLQTPEILLGLAAATVATAASMRVRREGLSRFLAHPRWLAQGWHLVGLSLGGTAEILVVLARRLAGRPAKSLIRAVRFERGGDPHDATRRALAIGYTTVAPNFVVIGIDQERGYLLYHQLEESPVPAMLRHLGAKG